MYIGGATLTTSRLMTSRSITELDHQTIIEEKNALYVSMNPKTNYLWGVIIYVCVAIV